MNYASFIIKILEKPRHTIFNNEIYVTRFNAEYPKISHKKNNTIIKVAIWGNESDDILSYLFVGDYIIIEGYISFSNKTFYNLKEIEISVFTIYPFLF